MTVEEQKTALLLMSRCKEVKHVLESTCRYDDIHKLSVLSCAGFEGGLDASMSGDQQWFTSQEVVASARKVLSNMNLLQALCNNAKPKDKAGLTKTALAKVPKSGPLKLPDKIFDLANEMASTA